MLPARQGQGGKDRMMPNIELPRKSWLLCFKYDVVTSGRLKLNKPLFSSISITISNVTISTSRWTSTEAWAQRAIYCDDTQNHYACIVAHRRLLENIIVSKLRFSWIAVLNTNSNIDFTQAKFVSRFGNDYNGHCSFGLSNGPERSCSVLQTWPGGCFIDKSHPRQS